MRLGAGAGCSTLRGMYSATFIYTAGALDDAYHRLDQAIAETARAIPGYLGEEAWQNPQNGQVATVYYWETLDALQVLMRDPQHQQAKAMQAAWLDGYQVIISQVLRSYGDMKLPHPTRRPRPEGG